jgi:putative restriction endonuclease
MPRKDLWTRDQLLAAFCLYFRIPFGKYDQRNSEVIQLANAIGRTPSAVAFKLGNFASIDPTIHQEGLTNVGQGDKQLWSDFLVTPDDIANQAQTAYETALAGSTPKDSSPITSLNHSDTVPDLPAGPTDQLRLIKVRRLQSFFRSSVLSSYENRCAISGLEVPELLVASHIIPWSVNEHRRADPRNGLCLNALYDKAFDRGLITFDENCRVVISPRLRVKDNNDFHRKTLLEIEGTPLILPTRFPPDHQALTYHRQNIFLPS